MAAQGNQDNQAKQGQPSKTRKPGHPSKTSKPRKPGQPSKTSKPRKSEKSLVSTPARGFKDIYIYIYMILDCILVTVSDALLYVLWTAPKIDHSY